MITNRNLVKGFFVGFGIGLLAAMSLIAFWFQLAISEYINSMQSLAEKTAHQQMPINLAFIQMAENGENDRMISGYCKLLRSQLTYFDPNSITDETVRNQVTENFAEARLVLAKLESEEKC